MKYKKYLILLFCSLIGCTNNTSPNSSNLFQISAGNIDRLNSIVSIPLTQTSEEKSYYLLGPNSQIIPTQTSGQKILFVLPDMKAGEKINLEVIKATEDFKKKMGINFLPDAVEFVSNEDKPIFQYRTGPNGLNLQNVEEIYYRGGYLHPVFTPKGHVITEQYTQHRPHQNGIWTGWYKTEWKGMHPNFWIQNEETGEVEFHSVEKIKNGPVYSELKTIHHFVEKITGNTTPILTDQWTIRTYAIPFSENWNANLFDIEVKQTNVTKDTVKLLEYIYGGVGFRGNDQWIGETNMQLITSEGENREEAHMSRAKWVLLSGRIDGEMTSIAILSHPDNLRFPQPIFVNQQEPFFIFSPLQLGDFILKTEESFTQKYRYIVIDEGIPSTEIIERLWQDYAHPPEVTKIKE